jgi:hypothetical protein
MRTPAVSKYLPPSKIKIWENVNIFLICMIHTLINVRFVR